jgi:hypothetical protein
MQDVPSYAQQDCPLTLAEGLAEYRARMLGLLDEDELTGRAVELFHNHDIAHVVFGCDITVRQEAMIDTWTIFGSTIGLSGYLAYLQVPEARQVIAETGLLRTVWESAKAFPALVRVWRQARRMSRPWPWRDHEAYLDRPLVEIRRELGIELVH